MVDLSFSLEGGEAVHRRLDIAAEGASNLKKPFQQISTNFMKTFDANFDSRGDVYGGWAARKPQYKGGSRIDTWPLLQKTGRMRKSFVTSVSDTSLTISNTASYFVYHQSNKGPRTRLPRRVMMKIRQQDATMIVKEVQYHLAAFLQGRDR